MIMPSLSPCQNIHIVIDTIPRSETQVGEQKMPVEETNQKKPVNGGKSQCIGLVTTNI